MLRFDIHPLRGFLLTLLMAMAIGCGGSESSDDTTPDDVNNANNEPACTPGFLGCECIDGTACFPGSDWICVEGTCREQECAAGSEGCVCYANNTCDPDENGEPLLCSDGVCQASGCEPGSFGCECLEDGNCDEGLDCQFSGGTAICAPADCEIGTERCPCGDARACDPGLTCVQEACIDPGCRPGAEDCYCRPDFGCDDGLECNGDNERCEPIGCVAGTDGCECDEGDCLSDESRCVDDICQQVDCPAGDEGCACIEGERCLANGEGVQLTCEGGVCRGPDCAPGDLGCACIDGIECGDGGECAEGMCQPPDCIDGTEFCGCARGLCEPGLRCRADDVCVDGTGFINNACGPEGQCERGSRCNDDDVCRRCTLGVPGCGCDDFGECFTGAQCLAGTCVAEADLPPVALEGNPCFSYCEEDLVEGDEVRECGPDNLLEGCVGGRTCNFGSCVFPDEEVTTCVVETECPFWQTCIDGLCLSECKNDGDCVAGKACNENVCRVTCDTAGDPCPENYHCEANNGVTGFCLPTDPAGEGDSNVLGGYVLNTTSLEFNNNQVTQRFALFNNSLTAQNFRIVKRSHLLQNADGTSDRATRAIDGPVACDPQLDEDCTCAEDDPEDCLCTGDNCACVTNEDCADDSDVCRQGSCRPSTCVDGICPLFWLDVGQGDEDPTAAQEYEVRVESGASVEFTLTGAGDMSGVRYQGTLEIQNDKFGNQDLDLFYNEVPAGQWAGEMVYLADFDDKGLAPWRVDQASRNTVEHEPPLANALMRLWVSFRNGRRSFDELEAIFTSVQTGSWKYPNVQDGCPSRNGACYPYDIGQLGLEVLTSDTETFPVPTGVVELPFGVNLYQPDPENSPEVFSGRIESSKALQYTGNPAVEMRFLSSPDQCDLEAFGNCVVWLEDFNADIFVGGRYLTDELDTGCADKRDSTYVQVREPWLVEGFENNTALDTNTGLRYRYECRDSQLPYAGEDFGPINQQLSLSNPVPDARSRRRTLRMIDGAMVNQSQLIIFFEERFDSFLGDDPKGFTSYGFMRLRRRVTDLDNTDTNANEIADVYEGSTATDNRNEPDGVLSPVCDETLLETVLEGDPIAGNLAKLVSTLIDGQPLGSNAIELDADSDEQVHYFCEDTGLFDGGPDNATPPFLADLLPNDNSCGFANNDVCEDGGTDSEFATCALGTDANDCGTRTDDELDQRVECPAGSRVEFFTLSSQRFSQDDIAGLTCQADGTCQDQLNLWKENNVIIQESPRYRCADGNEVFCDSDRQDLRKEKTFFAAADDTAVFVQIQSLIDEAFRYKTRFQNRDGQGIGFTPELCQPNSDAVPYCYDPAQIEEIQARIDCLLHIHQNHYDALENSNDPQDTQALRMLEEFLVTSFSQNLEIRPGNVQVTHDGFERQLSQLQIMLGDESFTRAFTSRFDLAAINTAAFRGDEFEPDGINLSGAAGFEMFSLYQAAQYYQMVLDRFYTMSPVMWEATQFGVSRRNFITADTVLRYFDRVIRASTQKARSWGEIAKRYQNLGRPDLARTVAERAYTTTYLESIVMSKMMKQVLEEATLLENQDQITAALEDAQLRYKVALVDMQNVYSELSDDITIFGFEPEFVPFPALDSQDFRQSNAFEVLLNRSRTKVQFAREKEELALSQGREFETNQAQFQSELNQLTTNFENQLADLCGTFVVNGEDDDPNNDRVLPAIRKYAHLNDIATLFADPCGLLGNGQIHSALAALEDTQIDARALQIQTENALEEIEIERARVSAQCGEILETADFLYGKCERSQYQDLVDDLNPFDDPNRTGCLQAQVNELQTDIRNGQFAISRLQQVQSILGTSTSLSKCGDTDCPSALASTTTFMVGSALTEAGIAATEIAINVKERQIAELERFKMKWQTRQECDMAKIESTARVRSMLLRLNELDLEALRIEHRSRLALSEIDRLRNQAKRIEAQQIEGEQLAINIQAAHNNPNVRIYKNDAIINAEVAFDAAIQEVYKLTRVFEYYTSTSYAQKNDLFLIRMIARGDKNLENYLNELETTFNDFEEFFGHPSNRLHIVSLKDDIFNIPFTDEEGRPLGGGERTQMLRDRLTDPSILDKDGYVNVSFSTNLESLSPLTRNHKILYMEADIYGNGLGDLLGRIYVRQKGTSVINGIEGDKQFYRFDERTAVINAIFGGSRSFENTIYQNFRHRDRPFANTQWELIINQRDEEVNQDFSLNALTDIRINIYYTDFTPF